MDITLQDIVDDVEDELLVIDSEYRVLFVNSAARGRIQREAESPIGKPCYEVLYDRDTPCSTPLWDCTLQEVLQTGNMTTLIHPVRTPRADIYLKITAYPLRDSQGNTKGIVELRRDVSAERELEIQILRRHHQLLALSHISRAVSGLRDFEHFTSVAGRPVARYETIGSHLISLLLVAGSYFRQKAPDRVGYDPSGGPVDARELFDRDLLRSIVVGVWEAYYEGFAGRPPAENRFPISPSLVDRMIEEMGVDRHMEEILRVVDQEAMSHAMFRSFLQSRGMTATEARLVPKGGADIPLMTGPHLGGFNQPISLPELIDFAAAGAAYCVAGRFRHETSGNR